MVRVGVVEIIAIFVIIDIASSLLQNTSLSQVDNNLKNVETRRRKKSKKHESTSSSSADARDDSSDDDGQSLSLSTMESSSTENDDSKYARPKSSKERWGWRKWHRKCTPCPEDMRKKWRDRSISWICGAYQRARRSFKSLCMMHYRNCQDGTMFVKIHDRRCENDTGRDLPHGDNFFYEYKVHFSDDPDSSTTDSETTSSSESNSKWR